MNPPTAMLHPLSAHPGYGTGCEVWLLRHGEVHADWQKRAYGGLDVPLSEDGERDTESAIRAFGQLPIKAVFSSPLSRALALGRGLAAATGAPLEIRAGLAEINRGNWQGMAVTELFAKHEPELAALYTDPWNYTAHGGETDRIVLERAWAVLEEAVSGRGERDCVALACHYNVIRVIVARALGLAPVASFRLRVDLSAACVLRDTRAGWLFARSNVKTARRAP